MGVQIGAVKKMTLVQYNNGINLFFDLIKRVKLQINSKDPMTYTDAAFVSDILFNSRMNCFHKTFCLSLLLLRDVGRWTIKL